MSQPVRIWLHYAPNGGTPLYSPKLEPGVKLLGRSIRPKAGARCRCDCGHIGIFDAHFWTEENRLEDAVWIVPSTGSTQCVRCCAPSVDHRRKLLDDLAKNGM